MSSWTERRDHSCNSEQNIVKVLPLSLLCLRLSLPLLLCVSFLSAVCLPLLSLSLSLASSRATKAQRASCCMCHTLTQYRLESGVCISSTRMILPSVSFPSSYLVSTRIKPRSAAACEKSKNVYRRDGGRPKQVKYVPQRRDSEYRCRCSCKCIGCHLTNPASTQTYLRTYLYTLDPLLTRPRQNKGYRRAGNVATPLGITFHIRFRESYLVWGSFIIRCRTS